MTDSPWPLASELSREAWRDRVRRYVRRSDRAAEPVFVGRHELFAKVLSMAAKAADGDETGSLTVVVGGCPGAGKSGFIAECKRRHASQETVVPIELRANRLLPGELIAALAAALGQPLTEASSRSRATEGGASVGVASVRTSSGETLESPSVLERAQRERLVPWRTVRDVFGHALRGRPILLFVDEAQAFTKVANEGHNLPLDLHQGPPEGEGCVPIVPVYAGLADTEDVLADEADITRLDEDNVFALEALTRDESAEYVRGVLGDHLGLTGPRGLPSRLYAWHVAHGSGWPQHLRSQMAAMAEAMLSADSRDLNDLDMVAACARMARRREDFYRRRARRVHGGEHERAMLKVLKAADSGQRRAELSRVAAQELAAEGVLDVDPGDFVDRMIHAGLLQRSPAGSGYSCPIPSVMGWLETGRHPIQPPALPGIGG